ncbi:monocyte chemotactic protein 1B-like [Carassius auratus]|uniref:Monocyte chemotactic protein 1B-like n=1 Tax=Carassius auratus TaxID=7957 RepID=A0A6P6JDK1_CARAU|nr:monocyte chemotactic protein 1B-like [Carassius auratus]
MRCVSVTLLLCLATMLLAQVNCQISGRANCLCLKTSNRVPRKENIESYMIQNAGVCHIDAILFKTVRGRFICADPKIPLATEAKKYVDKKKATRALPVNSASTFKTLSTTSQWSTTG